MARIINVHIQVAFCCFLLLFLCTTTGNRHKIIRKWEGNNVPYQLLHSFSGEEVSVITNVLEEISQKTCVKFLPTTNETDFVQIRKGPGCNAVLGRVGGLQVISLQVGPSYLSDDRGTCVTHGNVAHQVMHTLGFYHEHLRPDRDKYVTIIYKNVKHWKRSSFAKYHTALFNLSALPYDYDSVTHGSLKMFSGNGEMTIMPTQYMVSIGQKDGLSYGDIQKIRHVYCTANQSMPILFILLFCLIFIVFYH